MVPLPYKWPMAGRCILHLRYPFGCVGNLSDLNSHFKIYVLHHYYTKGQEDLSTPKKALTVHS